MTDTTMTALPPSLRVGQVLNRAFALLSSDFAKFFLLTAIAWLPYLVIMFAAGSATRIGTVAPALAGTAALSMLVWMALNVLGQAVVLYGSVQKMRGQSFAVGESLRHGLARFFPIVGMFVCMGIGLVFGFLLLIIPGVILSLMWSLALPVCVAERLGPIQSLKRSAYLTKGSRWQILGIWALIGLVNGVVRAVLQFLLPLIVGQTVSILGIFLWMVLAQAFTSIAVAVVYHDLRVAREGIDIDRIAAVFD
jgi:hypothetical protein